MHMQIAASSHASDLAVDSESCKVSFNDDDRFLHLLLKAMGTWIAGLCVAAASTGKVSFGSVLDSVHR
jgi:hypothetical protein